MKQKQLNQLAKAHSELVLGEQSLKNKNAVKSISTDYKAGFIAAVAMLSEKALPVLKNYENKLGSGAVERNMEEEQIGYDEVVAAIKDIEESQHLTS